MYTGTLIKDLSASVERAEQKLADDMPAKFDKLIAECDPPLYLAGVMTHIANRIMTTGDVNAWHLCSDIQDCFWEGKTEVCARTGCHQLEGLHKHGYCPNMLGGTFLSNAETWEIARQHWQHMGHSQSQGDC